MGEPVVGEDSCTPLLRRFDKEESQGYNNEGQSMGKEPRDKDRAVKRQNKLSSNRREKITTKGRTCDNKKR